MSILDVALDPATVVVAVDPGKVMNRVWVSNGAGRWRSRSSRSRRPAACTAPGPESSTDCTWAGCDYSHRRKPRPRARSWGLAASRQTTAIVLRFYLARQGTGPGRRDR